MFIVIHPTGNTFSRALIKELYSKGKLGRFYTSIALFSGNLWSFLNKFLHIKELNRRKFDDDLRSFTGQYPMYEIGRFTLGKLKGLNFSAHETGVFSVDNVYKKLDIYVSRQLSKYSDKTIVYAYEDGALNSFQRAKDLGMYCAYDLPIAYWETLKTILHEEGERYPQWKNTLKGGVLDSDTKRRNKVAELQLADAVIVPSKFVADSLPEWSKNKKIIISPFGSPIAVLPENIAQKFSDIEKRSLRVLFAGSMSQRKGLADLFEAMKLIPDTENIELVVMGSLQETMEFYRSQYKDFIYEQGRSHDKVLELMRSCDVFCLPSLIEGRALVMQEAMSQGLPLIITPNTGGEDLIIEGKTGFLVPIRSPQSIAEKMIWFSRNRKELVRMSSEAYIHSGKYTWENYATQIINAIEND